MSSSFLDLMLKVKVEQQQNETHCERDPLDLYVSDGGGDGDGDGDENNVVEGAVDNVINQEEEEQGIEERIQQQQQLEEEEEQQQLESIVNQEEEEEDEEEAHYDESGEPAYSPQPNDCVRKRVGRPPKNTSFRHERDGYPQVQMPYLSAEENDYELMDDDDDDVDELADEIDAENSYDTAPFNHEMPSSTTTNGWAATAEYSSARYISKRGYTSQKIYHCGWPGCSKTYKFMGSLTLHRRSHQRAVTALGHAGMMRKPWQSPGRKRVHWRQKGAKHFKCRFPRCPERFSLMKDLRDHMDLVHGGWHQKSFACSQCGRLYMHIKRLRAHQLVCTSTSLGDEVGFEAALTTPTTTVSSSFARPPRPPPQKGRKETFSCQNCQKVYKQVKRLRRHQLICFNNDISGATYSPNTSTTPTTTTSIDNGSAEPHTSGGVLQASPWTTGGKMRAAAMARRGGPRKICTKCGKKFKQFWRLKKHEGGCDGVLNIPLVGGAETLPISDGTTFYSSVLKQNQNTKACEKCGKFYIQEWRQKRHEMLCLHGITVPSNHSLNTSGTEYGLASNLQMSSSELSLTSQPENALSDATTCSSNGNIAQLQANFENDPTSSPIAAPPTLRSRIHSAQINSTTTSTPTSTTEQKVAVPKSLVVGGDPQVMAVVKQKGKWTYLIRTTSADGKEESVAFLSSAKARFSYSHSLINFFEKNRLWKCPSGAL